LTHLVQDHEHETEFNISLNEEEYLKWAIAVNDK
jgi:hypothetical protein